jgi:hypothetical protein
MYMPYAFIWTSVSCQGLKFTRLTNGLIENYNKYRKSGKPPDLLPHRNIASSIKCIIGSNQNYLELLQKNFSDCKKKRAHQDREDFQDEQAEIDYALAKENYVKLCVQKYIRCLLILLL